MKLKIKNKEQNEKGMYIVLCALVIIIFVIFYGTETYCTGYHNRDLGWNMYLINIYHNTSYVDIGSDYKARSPIEMVLLGESQQRQGLLMIIFGFFMTGLFIGTMLEMKK